MADTSSTRPKSVKRTLHAGKGKIPEYVTGTKAFFHYECLRPLDVSQGMPSERDKYEAIDDSRKPWPKGYGKPMELIFGKKFQLPIFETLLRSMLVDEISQFDVEASELYTYPMVSKKLRDISHSHSDGHDHHSHSGHMCAAAMAEGTGYAELDELMKSPTPLRFIFHLLDVQQPDDYEHEGWQLSVEDKLKSVDELRISGNEDYKQENFESAINKYREALTRLDGLILREKPGDPEWNELDQKNISLYLNLSQCYLQIGNFYEAVAAADEALSRDATNEKALYRRARARMEIWQLDEASADLDTLLSIHPSSEKLVLAGRETVKRKRAEKEKSSKNTAKNMMKALVSDA